MSSPVRTVGTLVWDLPVRLFHWLLTAAILGAWVTHKMGTGAFAWHRWFGYACLVLVTFRIVWGFVGTSHARFADFLRGPAAVGRYARNWLSPRSVSHLGHNPLGGWMVVVLLALVAADGITGLFANDEIFSTGPLYGYVSDETSDQLSAWHRVLADALWYAIGLHVLAITAYLVLRGENLIGPMLTGRKSGSWVPVDAETQSSRLWLALLICAACALLLYAIVVTAPEPSMILF
jgi:cytochrome b